MTINNRATPQGGDWLFTLTSIYVNNEQLYSLFTRAAVIWVGWIYMLDDRLAGPCTGDVGVAQ